MSLEYVEAVNNLSTRRRGHPRRYRNGMPSLLEKAATTAIWLHCFGRRIAANSRTHVREIRQQFEHVNISHYSVVSIVDVAPAISMIDIEIAGDDPRSKL